MRIEVELNLFWEYINGKLFAVCCITDHSFHFILVPDSKYRCKGLKLIPDLRLYIKICEDSVPPTPTPTSLRGDR